MKPPKDWSNEEVNRFLTLYKGDCWHELEWEGHNVECKKCNKYFRYEREFLDYFTPSDFMSLKEWFEQNEPQRWEEYLSECYYCTTIITKCFNKTIDPRNLVQFLMEWKEEWGWVDCPTCYGLGRIEYPKQEYSCVGGCKSGRVKHPALTFAEGL